MSEERFDVIVVGGGPAGSAAAYTLAKAGISVAVIERGETCGCKNMTGGRIYAHSLKRLIPEYEKSAPLERRISNERITFMTQKAATTIDFSADELGGADAASYSVIRADFDKWLAEEAEGAGAFYINGIRVDDLVMRNGKVCGIVAGQDTLEADVVILADGVNSLLAQKIGMCKPLDPMEVAVGAKEVIRLGKDKLEERFGLQDENGTAWMFVGSPTNGHMGGGFLYTNKDSVSLGIVTTVGDISHSNASVISMLDGFKEHPLIAPLIKGGETSEYSAHLVPEGGYGMIPQLYGEGVMLVGDAAGLVMNLGYVVRGMDLAIESGRLAAQACIEAARAQDFSAASLSAYKTKLDGSFVIKEMKTHRRAPQAFSRRNVFFKLPVFMEDVMKAMFTVDGRNMSGLVKKLIPIARKYGLVQLMKDLFALLRAV